MPKLTKQVDYEQLTLAELDAAAKSATLKERRAHLDQAAIFAALGEEARRQMRLTSPGQ